MTGGDAEGGRATRGSGSGSAKEVDRRSGGSEGGTSEERRSGDVEDGTGFASRKEVRLESVSFLRRKPAIASYVGERGNGEGGEEGEKEGRLVIKRTDRTLTLFVREVPVPLRVKTSN